MSGRFQPGEDWAIPITFRGKETEGGMGFDEQEPQLDNLVAMIPDGVDILLSADHFYGHPKLIRYSYRVFSVNVRLESDEWESS